MVLRRRRPVGPAAALSCLLLLVFVPRAAVAAVGIDERYAVEYVPWRTVEAARRRHPSATAVEPGLGGCVLVPPGARGGAAPAGNRGAGSQRADAATADAPDDAFVVDVGGAADPALDASSPNDAGDLEAVELPPAVLAELGAQPCVSEPIRAPPPPSAFAPSSSSGGQPQPRRNRQFRASASDEDAVGGGAGVTYGKYEWCRDRGFTVSRYEPHSGAATGATVLGRADSSHGWVATADGEELYRTYANGDACRGPGERHVTTVSLRCAAGAAARESGAAFEWAVREAAAAHGCHSHVTMFLHAVCRLPRRAAPQRILCPI